MRPISADPPPQDPLAGVTLAGRTLRDRDLTGLCVVNARLTDVRLSGRLERVVVNDVDVTAYVEAELDRRHPERVQRRAVRTVADHRALWVALEAAWAAVLDEARTRPPGAVHASVDGEWSLVDTLRHLVFATDAWVRRAVLGEAMPYHPLGLPHSELTDGECAAMGLDRGRRAGFDEIVAVRAERVTLVRDVLARLTDDDLDRPGDLSPTPEEPDNVHPVRVCLGVVLNEECEHLRYVRRDLAASAAAP